METGLLSISLGALLQQLVALGPLAVYSASIDFPDNVGDEWISRIGHKPVLVQQPRPSWSLDRTRGSPVSLKSRDWGTGSIQGFRG